MKRTGGLAFAPLLLALGLATHPAAAQRLADQYDRFLENRCSELDFARDPFDGSVAPGQAGPNLAAFCSRAPFAPSLPDLPPGSTIGSSVPGAGALGGGDGPRAEDRALRQRREDSPEGVETPDVAARAEWNVLGRGLALFLSLEAERQRQRPDPFEDGRRGVLAAVTAGADYRLHSDWVAGAALRGERVAGDFAGGGDYRARGVGVALFAGWLPSERSFLDLSVAVARQHLQSERIVARQTTVTQPDGTSFVLMYDPPPAAVAGSRRGRELRLHALWGHDTQHGRHTFGPRIGVTAHRQRVAAYTEEGETPMSLHFAAQSTHSLQSSLGVQARSAFGTAFGVVVPQLQIDWLHEFRDGARVRTVRFAEDLRAQPVWFGYETRAPDRDFLMLRASTVAVLPRGFSAFSSLHRVIGHRLRRDYGAVLGLRYEY